jgi:hypothetical protein
MTTIYIQGQKYISDQSGKVFIEKRPTMDMEFFIELNGQKVPAQVNGNIMTPTEQEKNNNVFLALYVTLGIILFIIVLVAAKKRKRSS